MAKFLLDKGADAAAPSLSPHEYPLHVAITYGNSSLVELLLCKDAASLHDLLEEFDNGRRPGSACVLM
ncbi:hypothetical protein MCOR27_004060 [Pyricularia oryzae]|uniref:Ankyrin n=1 Tax=Pyricularia grisea TaxID=148305 RepID=A0ABQ8NNX1_PYRGI|nr:hypothetical protein MCOR01_009027 [Pyricularia oryzae]KAI6299984.1 hypothetical protein MCOR33_004192 [Pyricularia grisea]KAI6259621.1 hypothetical protein MCOR19_004068 [Pyricularia oryzae]KAI6278610.1 hypothetical protein MCOR26_004591 [Pyricularia oryzae]KAI6281853.1 hypothetical protein MCOR27_004060 [Pyricularia oryzae]